MNPLFPGLKNTQTSGTLIRLVKNFSQSNIDFVVEQIKIMNVSTLLNSLSNDKRKQLSNIEFLNKQKEQTEKIFM